MTDVVVGGLAEFCRAVREHDVAVLSETRKGFVSRNWPMIVALDNLANAEFAAGKFESSLSKLQVLTDWLPDSTGMYLRRCRAEVRNNVPGTLQELVASIDRLGNDNELFESIDILIGEGRQDLADSMILTCAKSDRFSAGIMAASKARVVASTGHLREALMILETRIDPASPLLLAARVKCRLLEQLLDFEAAAVASRYVALQWGEEHDLQFALQPIIFTFDFSAGATLLRDFLERHPKTTDLVKRLHEELEHSQRAAKSALEEHGPIDDAPMSTIFVALSEAGTPASRILWGKQALMGVLRRGALTEFDYVRFAWFLPNWELAPVRHRILAAAAAACPESNAVKRGWLHYFITQRAYGDAALFCEDLLKGTVDVDILFFAIALLRLHQLAIIPAFMAPPLYDTLRTGILRQTDSMDAGFQFVMQDHLMQLGWTPPVWGPNQIPSRDETEKRGFRRLFGVTTGRLSRVSSNSQLPVAPVIRPVLAISGQLRGFKDAWASINRRLRQPVSAPVVMSVWDTSSNATGRHASRLERALPADIIARLKPEERYTDTFSAMFPQTAKLLFGVTEVSAARVRLMIDETEGDVIEVETENERVLEQLLSPNISPNMLKMYYKFARLESLIRDAEWRSSETFSHVIWARPDCEVVQLSANDLKACLAKSDVAWSSFVTETSFGDYAMVLPRRAFSVLASIFPRVCLAGDARLLPWRPNRSVGPNPPASLDAFGGPDVIFDSLLAEGYMPLAGIPRMIVKLRGSTVDPGIVRATFLAESSLTQ